MYYLYRVKSPRSHLGCAWAAGLGVGPVRRLQPGICFLVRNRRFLASRSLSRPPVEIRLQQLSLGQEVLSIWVFGSKTVPSPGSAQLPGGPLPLQHPQLLKHDTGRRRWTQMQSVRLCLNLVRHRSMLGHG